MDTGTNYTREWQLPTVREYRCKANQRKSRYDGKEAVGEVTGAELVIW
jgi:hypothetical protein